MVIELAGKRIEVENMHSHMERLCKDYVAMDEGRVDFSVSVTQTDMQRTIMMIDRLAVNFYRLSCNMDPSAAQLSYDTMRPN